MFVADNAGVKHARGGIERIDGRINALFRNGTRQNGRGVQMGEGGCRRRVGQIVGRDVNGLNRGDRALGRGGDALLHLAHIGCQRRLIAHRRRDTPKKRRDFRTGLREAEDVIDEEQHILPLIAEVLRNRQTRQRDAHARTRRLIHLAINQGAFRALGRAIVLLRVDVDVRLDHFVIKVIALAGPLTHAGEDRVATMRLRDVIDQFHDQHGLADAGTAEQADLAALGIGREQIDNLDAGFKHLRLGRLLGIGRRFLMDGTAGFRRDRTGFIHRLTNHVHDAAQRAGTHRHSNRRTSIGNALATHEPFGRVHRDAAHGVLAEVLRHFEHKPVAEICRLECVENLRQVTLELHVNDRADHLRNTTLRLCHGSDPVP